MPTIYRNMALVECVEPDHLDELLAGGLQRFAVWRLGPGAVQVDHERLPEVRKLLERLGETPRILRDIAAG